MIKSKTDLKRYIKADFNAQAMTHPWLARFTYGENWRMFNYMRTLRELEYYFKYKSYYLGEYHVRLLQFSN